MAIDLQIKLKNNPLYLEYLHNNSNWYKYLNRDPVAYKSFEEEAKNRLKLRPSDKIERMLTTFEMVSSIISSMK